MKILSYFEGYLKLVFFCGSADKKKLQFQGSGWEIIQENVKDCVRGENPEWK